VGKPETLRKEAECNALLYLLHSSYIDHDFHKKNKMHYWEQLLQLIKRNSFQYKTKLLRWRKV